MLIQAASGKIGPDWEKNSRIGRQNWSGDYLNFPLIWTYFKVA